MIDKRVELIGFRSWGVLAFVFGVGGYAAFVIPGMSGLGKLVAVLSSLIGIGMGVRAYWHGASWVTLAAGEEIRPAVQVALAALAAAIPFAYIFPQLTTPLGDLGAYLVDGWGAVGVMAVIGYVSFQFTISQNPVLPIRAFLVAIILIGGLAVMIGMDALPSGEDEDGYSAERNERGTLTNWDMAMVNYARYGIVAFGAIGAALVRLQNSGARRRP